MQEALAEAEAAKRRGTASGGGGAGDLFGANFMAKLVRMHVGLMVS